MQISRSIFRALIFATVAVAAMTALADDPIADATRQIVEGRELVQGYVNDIHRSYAPESAEYVEARKRYRVALSKYNGWAISVKRAIRNGKANDISRDPAYTKGAQDAAAAAKSFVGYVESKTAAPKGGIGAIFGALAEVGVRMWNAYKDRQSQERQADADSFYEDVQWDQWEVLTGGAQASVASADTKGQAVDEIHLGDPPDERKGRGETLTIAPNTLTQIERDVSGESKGPAVDAKRLALETLELAKEYAGSGVSRAEPPSPTKVKAFLSLYGLPFRYETGGFVPYCAAGLGYAAARTHYRLSRGRDAGEDVIRLREVLPDVTRDYAKTHPATRQMMSAAKSRKHANGESFWVSAKEQPQQGWLVFFNWTGGDQPQHVGIVDSVVSEGRVLKTVEFNTSSGNDSNGGKVQARTRSVRYVVGYIRTYPSSSAAISAPAPAKGAAAAGVRRALLVGINDYEHGTNADDGWRNLNTQPDLKNLKHVLKTSYGFKPADILTLRNDQATQENIQRQFRTHLVENAKPGDTALFYFTGHGFQIDDVSGDEVADLLDEVLVTWVPKSKQSLEAAERRRIMYLADDNYQQLLRELTARMRGADGVLQGSVVVIFDSCNSGSAAKGSAIRKGRPWNEAIDGPRRGGTRLDVASGWLTPDPNLEGVTFLSGSQSNEFSYMMPNSARDGSAMTFYLSEFLTALARQTSDRPVTYDDLYRWVSVKVSALHAMQNPQAEGNVATAVFGDGKPVVANSLPQVLGLSGSSQLELSEGSLHGVTVGSRYEIYKRNSDVTKVANRIAVVEIEELGSITSRAKIMSKARPAPADEAYPAAQAVLVARRFDGRPLRVRIDSSLTGARAKPLTNATQSLEYITYTSVTETNFDLKFAWDGSNFIYQRADGTIVPLGSAIEPERLQKRLLAEWRRKRIAELTLSAPSTVRLDITGRDGTSIERTPGNGIVFRPGDEANVSVTNNSTRAMFVTIVYLDVNGNIATIPGPAVVNSQQPVEPDRQPHHLFNIDGVREPYGIEMIKLIATTQKADFSGMNFTAKARPRAGPNPLAPLLFGIVDGTAKNVSITQAGVESWATDQILWEIRPGKPAQ